MGNAFFIEIRQPMISCKDFKYIYDNDCNESHNNNLICMYYITKTFF